MEFVPIVVMLALVKKIVDTAKYATARDWNGVITQLVVWVGGFVVVAAFAASDWAGLVAFGDINLAQMNLWSQILAGTAVGSAAALAKDTLKAVDNSQSERTPPLLPSQTVVTPPDAQV
jgi:hypothetical protein